MRTSFVKELRSGALGPSSHDTAGAPLVLWDGGSGGGGGVEHLLRQCGWHEAVVLVCLPLTAPIGLSPLLILTLCGPERVLVVSTEPPDDLSCLTTPGVGRPGDGAVARAVDGGGGWVHERA